MDSRACGAAAETMFVFALGVEKKIDTRHEWVIHDVPASFLETLRNSFASQLSEGVQSMHQHNVAHLDLNPGNIVVTPSTSPQRLLLIDFSVSVRLPDQESWIEGYRGTERERPAVIVVQY